MINTLRSVLERCLEIRAFEIRQFFEDLLGRELGREQLQDIRHPNPHTANAGAATALLWVDRNP